MGKEFNITQHLFGKDNQYFGSFYVDFDNDSLRSFLKENDLFRRQLTYFFFYLETIVCVKNIPHDLSGISDEMKAGSYAGLHAHKLWYSVVISILMSIFQHSQTCASVVVEKCETCGRGQAIRSKFKTGMNLLNDDEKRYLKLHYKSGTFNKKDFEKIVEDIYSDRNYFAHEIDYLETPESTGLTFELVKGKGVMITFNIKPEEIILYIIKGLLRYNGYTEKIEVMNSKEADNLPDFL